MTVLCNMFSWILALDAREPTLKRSQKPDNRETGTYAEANLPEMLVLRAGPAQCDLSLSEQDHSASIKKQTEGSELGSFECRLTVASSWSFEAGSFSMQP